MEGEEEEEEEEGEEEEENIVHFLVFPLLPLSSPSPPPLLVACRWLRVGIQHGAERRTQTMCLASSASLPGGVRARQTWPVCELRVTFTQMLI